MTPTQALPTTARPGGAVEVAGDRLGAEVDRLLGMPVPAVLSRHIGVGTLRADLTSCLSEIAAVLCASPSVLPPTLTDVFSGGKRLRPLLVLATAYAAGPAGAAGPECGRTRPRAVAGATAVELLHLASLVHDDIMDQATRRHGVGTINARAGTDHALLVGDLLFAQAHVAASRVGAEAATLIGHTLVRLCEGQAEETATRYDVGRTEESYLRSIAGKTGALIGACCRLGALAAGCDPATRTAMGWFGLHLGVAFQLADDLLDLTETQAAAGKPVGNDLVAGVYTYPTLWSLRRDSRLGRLLSKPPGPNQPEVAAQAARRIREVGGLAATRRAIARHRERGVDALTGAGLDCAHVELLVELAQTVVPGG